MTAIMVTGVGGGVGQSIIKSLQGKRYRIVGVDSEAYGTGLYAVHRAYQVPQASASGYLDRILELGRAERCSLLFPGMDAELPVLAEGAERLRDNHIIPMVSSHRVIDLADNKLKTSQFLQEKGFPAPLTVPLASDVGDRLGYPLVLKPWRGGRRSLGMHVIRDEDQLRHHLARLDQTTYIAQQYISGDEYTCGTVSFDGRCYGTIVMRRVLRDGDTYKAFVDPNPVIHEYVQAVAEAIRPFGACNFQLRLQNGVPFIFEINARFSGTTFSRALAGFNEPQMVADYILWGRTPEPQIREIAVFRYWKELVVPYSRIAEMENRGCLDGDGTTL